MEYFSRKLQISKIISLAKVKNSHFNAEFQRIARRDKKAFLRDQCKEIEENKRMGKTRDLFKKKLEIPSEHFMQRWAKHFIQRREMVKTQQKQKILKRGGKNTQKNYTQKDLHDPDSHNAVITQLEPDILKCGVKQALGNITMNKASGGDGTPAELFRVLKDDAVKVLR